MLEQISRMSGLQLKLVKQLPIKQERDYLLHYIFENSETLDKYICAIATNDYQKFALRRSLEMIYRCKTLFGNLYEINLPICDGEIEEGKYTFALYRYIDKLENISFDAKEPIEIIKKVYRENAIEYIVDAELVTKIEESVLSDFPEEAKHNIMQTEEYADFFRLLKTYERIQCITTHADYSPSNILKSGDRLYLMDFEQGGELLPIGYDLYHYCRFINKENEQEIPYLELNQALWNIRHISHERRGMGKYMPMVELAEAGKKNLKLRVIENNKIVEINIRRNRGYVVLDMQSKDITPYAFYLLLKYCFLSLKHIKKIYVYNSRWWIEGLINIGEGEICFQGEVQKRTFKTNSIYRRLKCKIKELCEFVK